VACRDAGAPGGGAPRWIRRKCRTAAGAGGPRRDPAKLNCGARGNMSPVKTPLLDRVRFPADLRNFSPEQLRQVADELRAETIDAVSVTGGHLGASLGVGGVTGAIHAI